MAKATSNTFDLVLGIVLIVLGVLMLVGSLDIPFLKEIVAILLIVVGIVMLVQKQSLIVAIVAIAVGVLMLVSGEFGQLVDTILTIAIGVALIVGGVLKVLGKW